MHGPRETCSASRKFSMKCRMVSCAKSVVGTIPQAGNSRQRGEGGNADVESMHSQDGCAHTAGLRVGATVCVISLGLMLPGPPARAPMPQARQQTDRRGLSKCPGGTGPVESVRAFANVRTLLKAPAYIPTLSTGRMKVRMMDNFPATLQREDVSMTHQEFGK
jgi:hypothetical protein